MAGRMDDIPLDRLLANGIELKKDGLLFVTSSATIGRCGIMSGGQQLTWDVKKKLLVWSDPS